MHAQDSSVSKRHHRWAAALLPVGIGPHHPRGLDAKTATSHVRGENTSCAVVFREFMRRVLIPVSTLSAISNTAAAVATNADADRHDCWQVHRSVQGPERWAQRGEFGRASAASSRSCTLSRRVGRFALPPDGSRPLLHPCWLTLASESHRGCFPSSGSCCFPYCFALQITTLFLQQNSTPPCRWHTLSYRDTQSKMLGSVISPTVTAPSHRSLATAQDCAGCSDCIPLLPAAHIQAGTRAARFSSLCRTSQAVAVHLRFWHITI